MRTFGVLAAAMAVSCALGATPSCTYGVWTNNAGCSGDPQLSMTVPPRKCSAFPDTMGSWMIVLDGDYVRVDQFSDGGCKNPLVQESVGRPGVCAREGVSASAMVTVEDMPYRPQAYHVFWWGSAKNCQGRYDFNNAVKVDTCTRVTDNATVTLRNEESENYVMVKEWAQDPDGLCGGQPTFMMGAPVGTYCWGDRIQSSYQVSRL